MQVSETNLNIQQVLPYDGTVNYYGNIFTEAAANFYLDYLLHSIDWQHDQAFIFGKLY